MIDLPGDQSVMTSALGFAARAAVVLVLVLVTLALARRVKGRIRDASSLTLKDPAVAGLISNLAYVTLIALGVLTALSAADVNVTAIVTALGVTGLAISLALQDVLRNFVAGIYILLEKPFTIGDHIALRDFDGDVESIELRTTLVRAATGAQVIVPNSVLMTDVVTNRSTGRLRPYAITVSGDGALAGYDLSDLTDIARSHADVAPDPAPEAYIESIEEGKTTVRLTLHTRPGAAVVPALARELQSRLPDATVTVRTPESQA